MLEDNRGFQIKKNLLFSPPRNGSEGNLREFASFFPVVLSSTEGFGTEFREFLFRGTAGIPSEITICSDYSVFRGNIFLSEIPNPICLPIATLIYMYL
jgi:hypothetical protein